jgi:hypothetical protein
VGTLPAGRNGRVRPRLAVFGSEGSPSSRSIQQTEALARMAQGVTLTAIARSYNVSQMTITGLAGVAFMQ